MKKTLLLMATLLLALGCSGPKAPKVLVLYYSQSSNTESVAQQIAAKTGADIEKIVPAVPYDGTYQETLERGRKELDGALPEIQPLKSDISSYDVIFLGYPIWFGTYATPVGALLEKEDFAGKKVVPFCTFGSGGLDTSSKALANKLTKATVLPGYGVRAARMASAPAEIDRFLMEGGFIKGDFEPLPDFSAERDVTEAESAVFDTAVGDYPMISAYATKVASRPVPGGTEYLFTALNKPGEDGVQRPGQMKIYVIALDGKAPEFTQVLR
ncbi:MAG: hypothetical protein II730_08850 [Bacteroidales bacterium]|nr:hypothetical protein [Bacteroidales bacterium]